MKNIIFLLNIFYCYYGAGVQVCDRQPSARRVIRPTMYQHATTGLSNRIACRRWRPEKNTINHAATILLGNLVLT
jgi:hypothetical protein